MLRSGGKVETVEKLPSPNHVWQGLERSVSPFLSYRLMLRVGGFGFVLLYAEEDSLSTVKGMEEATWNSEQSGSVYY